MKITLNDIFKQNDELYKNLVDCITKLEAKLDNLQKGNSSIETTEIPDTEYVTITADNVFVGGQAAKEYHGQEIYNLYHCPAYVKEARDIIRKEYDCELLEIHCLQSSTDGEYTKPGNPIADKNGIYVWCRVVYLDKNNNKTTSLWVFLYSDSSADECAGDCAYYCGYYAQYYSAMRGGLFGSVRQ